MSTQPRSAEEFDAYLAKAARGSRISGVLGLVGLTLVLGALILSTRSLADSRRELTSVRDSVRAGYDELANVRQQLRLASDSLVRVREGFTAFRRVVRQQSPALAQAATQVAQDSARSARVVYIQFRGSLARATANALRARLNGGGFNAPGVERIDRSYGNSVRYFHPGDVDAARELARTASAFFAEQGCAAEFPLQDNTSAGARVPQGQLEIWINLNCRPAASAG